MRAEPKPGRSKYFVALDEAGYVPPYCCDSSRELHPQYLDLPGPPKSGPESYDQWHRPSHSPVRCRNCCRMNADEDLVFLRNRLLHVRDFYDLWRPVEAI